MKLYLRLFNINTFSLLAELQSKSWYRCIIQVAKHNQIKTKIMEVLLGSPGLSHIIQEIFRSLDFKSLVSCRLVCKSANNQVKDLASKVSLEDLEQLLEGFAKARSMTDFEKRQWNRFLIHMFTNWSESINDWSESNRFMNLYLKEILSRATQYEYKSGLDKSPILEFVLYGNKEMVEYILYNGDSGYKY